MFLSCVPKNMYVRLIDDYTFDLRSECECVHVVITQKKTYFLIS